MKLIITLLCLAPTLSFSQTLPLPNVHEQASKALNLVKEHHPVANCIKPNMFTSQSPLQSSVQIGNCVKSNIKNLKLSDKAGDLSDEALNLKTKGTQEFYRLQNCFSSSSSFNGLSSCF